jgi:acetyltransferase-like isoleucine patch superfamily enzyme
MKKIIIKALPYLGIAKYRSKEEEDYEYLKKCGVDTEIGYVKLIGRPIIQKHPKSLIKIESGVTLISDTNYNIAGISHPVILATLREDAEIIIRKDSGLSGATVCAAKKIDIGEYVGIGANACIYDTDFHAINPYDRRYDNYNKTSVKPIIIESYAWIGGNSIILKGSLIGKGTVIGAGSVVTGKTNDLSIYAGNPAKFIKKIEIEDETYNNLFNSGKK